MARQYTSRPGPTRIAHVVSSGRRIRGAREAERKRLEEAAEIVAEKAREISSGFSRRIPLSVRVRTYRGTTYVEAGGPTAPNAFPFDPPPGQVPSRHPLFGNRKHWYNQPYRPFLEEAAEEAADKAAEAYAKVVDDWCRETGLTQR
jgi:hypothetical protein